MGRRYRSGINQRIVQSELSWQGPIVLNWLDIQDSFDASGFNLIIHEVALSWTPVTAIAPASSLISLREVVGWNMIFMLQMNNIQEEIELVENAASIDAYAASDPAECFTYFLNISLAPQNFCSSFPSLWQRLVNFINKIFAETASR